jgi:hypothetical protein
MLRKFFGRGVFLKIKVMVCFAELIVDFENDNQGSAKTWDFLETRSDFFRRALLCLLKQGPAKMFFGFGTSKKKWNSVNLEGNEAPATRDGALGVQGKLPSAKKTPQLCVRSSEAGAED